MQCGGQRVFRKGRKRGQANSLSVCEEQTQHPSRLRVLGLFSLKGRLGVHLKAILYYITRML